MLAGGRRRADRSASRHRLAATRYSQVRTEARPSNPARPGQALPGILQRVLSILHRAQEPVAVHLQLTPVGINELAKRLPVAVLRPGEQVRRHDASFSSATSR